jgi:aryl-alcohol dehydrogenase-like predicted oxidoreductase
MEYRKLGRTALRVSPICIGTWQLAGPLFFDGTPDGHPDPGKQNVLRLIQQLHDRGVNFIDTAEQYGGGESERRVGEAISHERDAWIVSTKFGYRVASDGSREDDSSPATIMSSLEGSLRRLRTDHVDIYLFHCPPRTSDLDASREVLERAREQGKIRYYGISTSNLDLARAMLKRGMLDVVQYPTNLLDDAREMRTFLTENGIGTQVRGVMAQGRLSGRYFESKPVLSTDDRRSVDMAEHDFARYAVLQQCLPSGYTMIDAAIRWVLDQPGHHAICAGAKRLEDYEAMLQAVQKPPLGVEITRQLEQCARNLAG